MLLLLLSTSFFSLAQTQATPVAVEVAHSGWDCKNVQKYGTCDETDHYHFWVNGKEFKDRKDFETRLSELGKGPASLDRKILFSPNLKTPFGIVWPVLSLFQKLKCTQVIWWDEKPPTPAKPRDGDAPAPLDILLRIDDERLKGFETQVEGGPWLKKDAAIQEALVELGGDTKTRILIDSDGRTPWGAVAHLAELCRSMGLTRIEFLGIPGPMEYGISEAEAARIAERIDKEDEGSQPDVFDELIDRQELHRRLTADLELSGLIRHLVAEMFALQAPSAQMLRKAPQGQKALHLLRVDKVGGQCRPLFRYLPEGGLDYVQLILAKDDRGNLRVVDLYSFGQNAFATEAFRNFALTKDKVAILNQLKAPTPGDLAVFDDRAISELMRLMRESKFVETIDYFKAHANELRSSPIALRVYVNASKRLNADAFLEAVAEMERHSPQSKSLPMLRMESLITKGDPEKALGAIDALDREVGGDPYLELQRCRVYQGAGDSEKARQSARRSTERERDLAVGWWTWMDLCVASKNYKELCDALTGMEKGLNLSLGDLEQIPSFGDFVKTAEYRQWKESRKK